MEILKSKKTKVWMLILILLMQIVLPALTVLVENNFTLVSTAANIGEWDISANGDGTVTAILGEDGTLTISGTGEMKSYNDLEYTSYIKIPWYSYKAQVKNVVINSGITRIGASIFYQCTQIESITIPESVTSIGNAAFSGCTSLEKITLPSGITEIEDKILFNCTSLSKVTIPETVTKIGAHAFYNCSALTSIILPEELTEVGQSAFYNCSTLRSVRMPFETTKLNDWAFAYCSSLSTIIIPDNVQTIGKEVFKNCENLTIYCRENSYVQLYAQQEDILYAIENEKPEVEIKRDLLEGEPKQAIITINATDNGVGLAKKAYSFDGGETWQAENTKTYLENTKDIVIKVRDALGNEETIETEIDMNRILDLEFLVYDVETENEIDYLINIVPATAMKELLENIITSATVKVYKNETEITDETTIIVTGMKLIVSQEEKVEEYVIVVRGDTTGDGQADIKDILSINKHRLNKTPLAGEYLKAGNVTGDANVDIMDILQINKFRLGKVDSL